MEVRVPQQFIYEIDGSASLSDIAQSLLSIERITKVVGPLLEATVRGVSVQGVEIGLHEITHQSPVKEIFWTAVFLTYQKDLEREIPSAIEQLTGAPLGDGHDTIVTVLTLIVIFYAVDAVYQRVFAAPSRQIQRMFNGLVDDAAAALGVSREHILENLEKRYGGSKVRAITRAAVEFFSIAKHRKARRMLAGSREIKRDVIDAVPSVADIAAFDEDEITEPVEDVEIELHAQDLDRAKQGWAGIIRSVSEQRLRLQLYPPLTPEQIYRQEIIRADVIVVSKRRPDGGFDPYLAHVVRLR